VARVAAAVGIGAVKYADLAMNRQSNYRFSFDKMLSLTGNTAPYMLYAYARVRGIQRRAAAAASLDAPAADSAAGFVLREPAEVNLARQLLRLGQVVSDVERDLLPSKLCEYIFELAGDFNRFYEAHLPSSPPAPALLRPLNAAPRRALCAGLPRPRRADGGGDRLETRAVRAHRRRPRPQLANSRHRAPRAHLARSTPSPLCDVTVIFPSAMETKGGLPCSPQTTRPPSISALTDADRSSRSLHSI